MPARRCRDYRLSNNGSSSPSRLAGCRSGGCQCRMWIRRLSRRSFHPFPPFPATKYKSRDLPSIQILYYCPVVLLSYSAYVWQNGALRQHRTVVASNNNNNNDYIWGFYYLPEGSQERVGRRFSQKTRSEKVHFYRSYFPSKIYKFWKRILKKVNTWPSLDEGKS